jgi:hypothetical protein
MLLRRLTATGLVALGCLGSAFTVAVATGQSPSEPTWTPLFDGKTIEGWTALPLGKAETHWEVKDGLLEGSGGPSMLYSPRGDYQNFKFRAEVKINDKGNSGMYVRAAKKASFTDGYEIQVNSTHGDPIKTGSLYTLVHLFKAPVPPDTWFTQEIEVKDVNYRGKIVTQFKISVNDEVLYEYLDHDRHFASGHFAFQQHDPGSKVSIRKVEVMELPPTKLPDPPKPAAAKVPLPTTTPIAPKATTKD